MMMATQGKWEVVNSAKSSKKGKDVKTGAGKNKKAFLENVEFPYTLTNQDIDKLVIKGEQNPYLATIYT